MFFFSFPEMSGQGPRAAVVVRAAAAPQLLQAALIQDTKLRGDGEGQGERERERERVQGKIIHVPYRTSYIQWESSVI